MNSNIRPPRVSILRELRHSWPGAIVGAVFFVIGAVVIFWNEGKAVKVSQMLEEAISSVTIIDPSRNPSQFKEKLLYVNGPVSVREPLTEKDYGVSVMAVKLKRRVQMFQWIEEETQDFDADGNVVSSHYSYFTDWKDQLIDSNMFHEPSFHQNPKTFPLKSTVQISDRVKIGNFELGSELKNLFGDFVEVASDERPEGRHIKLHAGLYYHSDNVWSPQVGDIRIQFSYAGPHGMIYTVIAFLDASGALRPYKSPSGLNLLILRSGSHALEDVFLLEHSWNKFRTWGYRILAWFLMFVGCFFMKNVLWAVVLRVRFLRIIFPVHLSSLTTIVSLCSSLIATSLAWMWFRPELAGTLLLLSFAFVLCAKYISQPSYQRLH